MPSQAVGAAGTAGAAASPAPACGKNMVRPVLALDRLSFLERKGQVMVRYYGLYANAHLGKVRKAGRVLIALRALEKELPRVPSKGWAALAPKRRIGLRSAEMIRKVYEVDPMICPRCGSLAGLMASMSAGG